MTQYKISCLEHVYIFNKMSYCTYFDGILPKGPYPPCLRMADRALLAGCPRFVILVTYHPYLYTQARNHGHSCDCQFWTAGWGHEYPAWVSRVVSEAKYSHTSCPCLRSWGSPPDRYLFLPGWGRSRGSVAWCRGPRSAGDRHSGGRRCSCCQGNVGNGWTHDETSSSHCYRCHELWDLNMIYNFSGLGEDCGVSYTRACETNAGRPRLTDPTQGMGQLFVTSQKSNDTTVNRLIQVTYLSIRFMCKTHATKNPWHKDVIDWQVYNCISIG